MALSPSQNSESSKQSMRENKLGPLSIEDRKMGRCSIERHCESGYSVVFNNY